MNRKRSIFAVICSIVAAAVCSFTLFACDEDEETVFHTFGDYVYNNDATCGSAGTETAVCTDCGLPRTRISEDHPATGKHSCDDYGVCTVCYAYSDDAPVSVALQFTGIQEGGNVAAYEVSGIGEADDDIMIPATHNGKPVTRIGSSAFADSNYVKSVVIPHSVKSIRFNAFSGCKRLTSVKIYKGVTEIGDWAFNRCTALREINIPNSVTSIGSYAFGNCEKLDEIDIPDSVTRIDNGAFNKCTALTNVVLPKNLTEIESNIFDECSKLRSVTVPVGVTSIGYSAFGFCELLETIDYAGTIKQWRAIKKADSWNLCSFHYRVVCTDGTLSKSDS